MANDWTIRSATGDDLELIYATWLRSFWDGSQSKQGFRKTIFFKEYPKVIDRLLSAEGIKVLIACSKVDATIIFGYAIADLRALHYVYTKYTLRGYGVAQSLVEYLSPPKVFTHRTRCIEKPLRKHPEYDFNPFLLMGLKEEKADG